MCVSEKCVYAFVCSCDHLLVLALVAGLSCHLSHLFHQVVALILFVLALVISCVLCPPVCGWTKSCTT